MKRNLILQAALRIFEAEGLEGASMRAIAREAGYTAGAIYFHFPSKEAIYAAALDESLERLSTNISRALEESDAEPPPRLRAAALAFFDFYASNACDLELGFYLFRGGIRPRGLSPELDAALNAKLADSLAAVGNAARALGADGAAARATVADVFAHAVGLLVLQHTRRIEIFACSGRELMCRYIDDVISRLSHTRPAG